MVGSRGRIGKLRAADRQASFGSFASQHTELQLCQFDAFVVEFHLREQAVLFENRVCCVVGIVEAPREAFTRYVVDVITRVLLLTKVVLQREGAVQFDIQRHERNGERQTRLLRVDPCSIAFRYQPSGQRCVLAPQVQLIA